MRGLFAHRGAVHSMLVSADIIEVNCEPLVLDLFLDVMECKTKSCLPLAGDVPTPSFSASAWRAVKSRAITGIE